MFTHDRFAAEARRTVWMAVAVLTLGLAPVLVAQGPPQGLPPQASPVARSIIEGELEVQIEDSEAGTRTHRFVHTSNGRVRLEMTGDGPDWETGTLVRARGHFRDALTLELGSADDGLEPMALANPNTFGEQRTIVIMVNFQDNQSVPYSASHASNVTFGQTSNFYLENSHGQTWLTGDVAGWFTLPIGTSTCDYNAISSYADQAAAAAGYNLSQYKRKVYAFPKVNACSWWGLGSVGGNPSRSWINGTFSLKVVAHELGHNFGDYHSRSQACSSTGCTTSEYGDNADVMGNPTSGHLNAYQKERLGWLNYGDLPAIQSVGSTGDYWIDSYSVNNPSSAAPKAIKILRSIDGNGKRTWYYVEARTQAGFDSGVSPGVILHSGNEGNAREIYQTDVQPTTTTNDWRLNAGQSFTDAAIGVRITTLWSDSTGAMIEVVFDNNPCTTAAPVLSASPSGMVTTTAGTAVSYSVNVTNADASACAGSTFSIDTWVPSGWTASASPATLTLAPGASGGATVTVTPSSTATGSTDIQIGAYRSGGSGASMVRTVQIEAPTPTCSAGTPQTTTNPSGTVSTPAGSAVSYSVTVKNTDSNCSGSSFALSAGVPSGWTASWSPSSLSLAAGAQASATLTVTPSSTASGSHSVSIGVSRSTGPGASVSRTIEVTQVTAGPIEMDLTVSQAKGGHEFRAVVRTGTSPVPGVPVSFTVNSGTSVVATLSGVTDSSGVATAVYRSGGGKNAKKGIFTVSAAATVSGQTATASVEFMVK